LVEDKTLAQGSDAGSDSRGRDALFSTDKRLKDVSPSKSEHSGFEAHLRNIARHAHTGALNPKKDPTKLNGADKRNHMAIRPINVRAGTAPDECAETRKKLSVKRMVKMMLFREQDHY
jgi:hypothetical protein